MDDFKLSEHFTFFELTATSNSAMQEKNRELAATYVPSIKSLALNILEPIRGDRPLTVNCGFRSWELNSNTHGSSPTSQHPKGQAADISRKDQTAEELFAEIEKLLVEKKIPFGQLILEQALRDYGLVKWVHVSLGAAFWKPERCGEVMKMVAGPNGIPQYTLLYKIPQDPT